MNRSLPLAVLTLLIGLLAHGAANARARMVGVSPQDGGCVGAPTGQRDETWAVEPGRTYTLRLDRVTEFANGGNDRFLDVLVANTSRGDVPLVATRVGVGTYEFTYAVPAGACEMPRVHYGVTRGVSGSGLLAGRHDDGSSKSQLSASTFGPNCTHPVPILCTTPTLAGTWGSMKSVYR